MNSNIDSDHWNNADRTEAAPRPTYAPAGMAMGITMLAWGIMTHWTMSVAGAGLIGLTLFIWMNEICKEWSRSDES